MNTTTAPAVANSSSRLPPGPRAGWWGFPLLSALKADYLGFTTRLHREHGDLTFMQMVNERAYDVFSPELVREILVDHADALIRWERGIEVFEQAFGQSVLVTEGAVWQRQRRMLHAAFTPRRVAGYAELMRDAAHGALDSAVPSGQAAARVDMEALLTRVAMDVIMRTLFSRPASEETTAAAHATQVLSASAMREMFWPVTLPDWLPLPGKAAKRQALATLRQLVAGHIRDRRAEGDAAPPRADLLGMLLSLRDEGTGEALTDTEVFDQCMVTFQAGHETTATALLWWSRLLAEHPVAAERAREEVRTALAGREPGADDLPWLTATLKEAMRLYPPVAALMTRRTTRAIEVGGWAIPKGALIRVTPWVLQRDARSFDAPDEFRPERFLPGAPPVPRGAWMPFGTGPRVCLGQHFAMLEMTLVAALMLQRFVWALPAGTGPCVPVMNVTLRPRDGLWLDLRRV